MSNAEPTYIERLTRSFRSLHNAMVRPAVARWIIFVLLVGHSGLLAYSAYVHSPTRNEIAHLVAGLSHWRFQDFRLYCVNPPLVRSFAAIPVLLTDHEEDWVGFHSEAMNRPVFDLEQRFLSLNKDRCSHCVTLARLACIPFCWIGAITCYFWARDLAGRSAGLLAISLWCLSPNILGHGSLVTADAGGAAFAVAASYAFYRWLSRPSLQSMVVFGLVLGLAGLAKTTLVILFPLWPVIWILYRLSNPPMRTSRWVIEAGMLVASAVIALSVLNCGYLFQSSFKPLKDYRFSSELLTGTTESFIAINRVQVAPDTTRQANRFKDTLLGEVPVPIPEPYLLGIDVQQHDFETSERISYLRGEYKKSGWWYYYLYAFVVKVPLGTLSLIVGVIIFRIARRNRRNWKSPRCWRGRCDIALEDEIVLGVPCFAILCVVSSRIEFNEHFRYVLPCLPFAFVWIAVFTHQLLSLCVENCWKCERSLDREQPDFLYYLIKWGAPFMVLSTLWSFCSSIYVYPHSLSFFNETVGGPLNGQNHLLGSNVDWGQDSIYVSNWIEEYERQFGKQVIACQLAGLEGTHPGRCSDCDFRRDEIRGDDNRGNAGTVDPSYLHIFSVNAYGVSCIGSIPLTYAVRCRVNPNYSSQ